MASSDSLKELEEQLVDIPFENQEQIAEKTEVIRCDDFTNPLNLKEKEVREILESKVFFSKAHKKIQDKIEIIKIIHSNVHTYRLQTWVQKRQLFWQFKKYKFGRIDDSSVGDMPHAWDIPVQDAHKIKPFSDQVKDVPVNHSEYIQPCFACSNLPLALCAVCGGNKKLVYYLNCKITWHSYTDEFVNDPHHIPLIKLRTSGEILCEQQAEKVNPISYENDEKVSEASERYHRQHLERAKEEKILLQRQFLNKIDVFTVHYAYKHKLKRVYIYGDNRQVHVPCSLSPNSNPFVCLFM